MPDPVNLPPAFVASGLFTEGSSLFPVALLFSGPGAVKVVPGSSPSWTGLRVLFLGTAKSPKIWGGDASLACFLREDLLGAHLHIPWELLGAFWVSAFLHVSFWELEQVLIGVQKSEYLDKTWPCISAGPAPESLWLSEDRVVERRVKKASSLIPRYSCYLGLF